jgi:hypothetical protein
VLLLSAALISHGCQADASITLRPHSRLLSLRQAPYSDYSFGESNRDPQKRKEKHFLLFIFSKDCSFLFHVYATTEYRAAIALEPHGI